MKVIGMKKLDFNTPENQTIKGYIEAAVDVLRKGQGTSSCP